MSTLTQAMVINAAVLFAVLEADLGPHRKIGAFRILRPVLLSGAIVPLFVASPATHGDGLGLEVVAVVAGVVAGLCAAGLTHVYVSPRTGRPVSRTGVPYAALWVGVIGARAAFSYGSAHWFTTQLGNWMMHHQVTSDAITDSLLLMAVAMTLTRTLTLATQAGALRRRSAVAVSA
ncbi:hypothetical protein SAMN05216223_104212 [Actinacidiphila yanglinensis]|uniref:Uncharacterized protein n=1 Tax=Actinacidiphila yanglinensis TaxID=310779 RepID=A0A1H5YXN3_9ACTN|nr:hypothetical protein [Actinacidiphila yanglinensis]SEG29039.1 hypothetical protein SAMN05216223_104212 [Actinacidiphila yanglinensis]